MTFDRRDYVDSLKINHAKKQAALLPVAQIVQAAAVLSDNLQRTPEWSRYCQILQGLSEKYSKRKDIAQQKLGDPNVVDDNDVRKLRQDIFLADISVDLLRFVIELPAFIMKGGEEAEKFLSDFDKQIDLTRKN
jgi:hypothetical protein